MERELGRPLRRNEVVHHKGHNGHNNHPSNLVVMTRIAHSSLHGKEGVEAKRKKGIKTKYNYEKLTKMYKSGLSSREIAKIIGCSHATVKVAVRKNGIMRTNSEGVKLRMNK